ncbi:MAG: exodeoxyribonuclease VII small subunit [Clostridia bacterium]|nr:exodeoxyribonuclease VII small subunit [Clostridia bacterium]
MKYEEAVAELEKILAKLESDNVGLDEAVALFEKSVELSKICFDKIKQTEGKVEIIKKELDEIKIKTFDDIDKKE